jgi:hypothetical protein
MNYCSAYPCALYVLTHISLLHSSCPKQLVCAEREAYVIELSVAETDMRYRRREIAPAYSIATTG